MSNKLTIIIEKTSPNLISSEITEIEFLFKTGVSSSQYELISKLPVELNKLLSEVNS